MLCENYMFDQTTTAPLQHSLTGIVFVFFFKNTATTEISTLSLHDALPISRLLHRPPVHLEPAEAGRRPPGRRPARSEEHTSELQSPDHLVSRLLLEKKKTALIFVPLLVKQRTYCTIKLTRTRR